MDQLHLIVDTDPRVAKAFYSQDLMPVKWVAIEPLAPAIEPLGACKVPGPRRETERIKTVARQP